MRSGAKNILALRTITLLTLLASCLPSVGDAGRGSAFPLNDASQVRACNVSVQAVRFGRRCRAGRVDPPAG